MSKDQLINSAEMYGIEVKHDLPFDHELKTWPEYFIAVDEGLKTFEIRKNDRDFKVGDILLLREFDPTTKEGTYTGRQCFREVTYITEWAQRAGHVVMGLKLYEHTYNPDTLVHRELGVISRSLRKIANLDDGWKDTHPSDEKFELKIIQAGSTGIHKANCIDGKYVLYDGEETEPLLVKWTSPIRG